MDWVKLVKSIASETETYLETYRDLWFLEMNFMKPNPQKYPKLGLLHLSHECSKVAVWSKSAFCIGLRSASDYYGSHFDYQYCINFIVSSLMWLNDNSKILKLNNRISKFCTSLQWGRYINNNNNNQKKTSKQIVDLLNLKNIIQTKVGLKFERGHCFLMKNQLFNGKPVFSLIIVLFCFVFK